MVTREQRGEIMADIIKKRGRPFNDTVRDFAQEYYETVAKLIYPDEDNQTSTIARDLFVKLMMDSFDVDFIANYHLFGKWLRQA